MMRVEDMMRSMDQRNKFGLALEADEDKLIVFSAELNEIRDKVEIIDGQSICRTTMTKTQFGEFVNCLRQLHDCMFRGKND